MMVILMVSMTSISCSVSNLFLYSNRNSDFFDPIRVASTLSGLLVIDFFLSIFTSSLMLLITSLWPPRMLTWLMTVTYAMFNKVVISAANI